MKIPFVDLKRQYQNHKEEIDVAIQDVIENTSFIGGPIVTKFEDAYAESYGVKHCVGVANGTDAIYIALKMLGVGPGDEVITTACSWISTSETISQTGATPVFVDVKEDFLIDVTLIESKITEKTKAIIPVHFFGQMVDIQSVRMICDKHNLLLVEDCAQAHFAERGGVRAGLTGDIGTFSFYPGKNLGAYGDAGAIITNNDDLATQCRMYAKHGGLVKHQHKIEGINSRLDTLQAAILSVKLKYIGEWTEARRKVANQYFELLEDVLQLQLPIVHDDSKHVYHVFCVRVERRDELKSYLTEQGVSTALHYPVPLPLLECYDYLKHNEDDFPIASSLSTQILSLPIFPEMTREEIQYVCDTIKEFYLI